MKTHVARVLAKLGVDNRAQAIVQALKRGLIAIEERATSVPNRKLVNAAALPIKPKGGPTRSNSRMDSPLLHQ